MRHLVIALAASLVFAEPSTSQELLWDNREPAGARSFAVDVDVQGQTVVASGGSCDEDFKCALFVRAFDRTSGRTLWQDELLDFVGNRANEVSVDASRVFIAGWSERPEQRFVFIVRAYDLNTGTLLWYREIDRSNFNIAKVLAVQDGRVYVAGHIRDTARDNQDYAVLAFDAATGTQLWEHVSDYLNLGQDDFAWSVAVAGDRVLVAGEVRGSSAMLMRAHNATDGVVAWEDEIPNARNFAEEHCLGEHGGLMFVCGSFPAGGFTDDLFVRAYDIKSGQVRWTDRVDDGGRLSVPKALTVSGGRLFVAAYLGCSPTTGAECKLTVRAYDPGSGALLWKQINQSPGNDWFVNTIIATANGVFVGGEQLNAAGSYEPTILSYDARSGTPIGGDKLDVGSAPIFTSFIGRLAIQGNHLIAAGGMWSGNAFGSDMLVRMYKIGP